jgi:voltage-gated potassium channel Kch
MLMESVHEHMTPENPDIKPSFGEQDFSVGAMRRGSTGNALRRSDSRMTGGFMGSGEAGSGAYNYGDYADSDSEDGAIHENTFAFIAVENDRLERERVIAIIDPSFLTWRHRWFCILEGRPHDKDETLALGFNMLSISFVLASCVIFCLQSLPINTNVERERSTDPYFLAETACIVFFILEAGWRVACVPLSHLFTGFFAIDIVTILGYFADLFNDANALSSVSQAMRLLRVFRVFKLSRYSTSLQMVFGVLKNSFGGLSMLVMPLALVAVVFSASIYLAEIWDATFEEDKKVWLKRNGFPAAIQSMPDAIWFTFTTITTVGYGDVVPETSVGKILAVLLMFVGVLTLSFPNIVLGANLQVAFKQSKSGHGIALYTRKIRKVGHVVAFIRRTQYWVAVRKAREAAKAQQTLQHQETFAGLSEQGRELAIRANYAFFPTHADFEAHRKPGVEPVRPSNLRHWTLRGVDPVHVLQTLLEVYSGVATASELYEDMVAGGMSGETRLKDVALTLLYLSESRIVRAFVLERNTTHMVVALMEPAVSELLLHAERADRQCRRSAEYARFVWKQTTGQLVPFTLSLLFNTYTVWSRRERYAEDDSIADLRLTIQMPEDVRKLLLEEEDADPMANSGRGGAPGVTNVGSEGALRSVPSITVSRSTAIGSKKRTVRGDALAASIAAPPKLAPAADLAQGLTLLHRAVEDTNQSIRALEAQMVAQHTGKAR